MLLVAILLLNMVNNSVDEEARFVDAETNLPAIESRKTLPAKRAPTVAVPVSYP